MNAALVHLGLFGLMLIFQGCAAHNVNIERLPDAPNASTPSSSVDIFEEGVSAPARAVIPIARIGASGNSYATKTSLVAAMAEKAKSAGAQALLVGRFRTEVGPTVYSFSGGMGLSETVRFPAMDAMAYVYAPARLGLMWDANHVIIDLSPTGSASKAGVRIGDRILAISGVRLLSSPTARSRAISSFRPGDSVPVELITPTNEVKTFTIIAESNE